MEATDFQQTSETKLRRIMWLSSRDKHRLFNNLMHLFNKEALEVCFNELDRKKAVGIDGVTKEIYGQQLDANLSELVNQLKRMSYKPGSIRKVEIPKEGSPGETRPLGISNFEDKLIQRMMHKVLESIYEPIFLDCSFGFRPGRGCHDAIRALRQHLFENEVEAVIDIDLANYFGTIDHGILLEILKEKIQDGRLLRYVMRMLKAGVLSRDGLTLSDEGVAQGSICSPILSNIFAHYVLDCWFEETVKIHCRGSVELYRYCDDAVICCQYEKDASRVKKALLNRLGKYKLKLNENKTKLVKFSKKRFSQGEKQESFDFLGFTFYLGKSRKNAVLPKLKSSGKRIRSKLKNVNAWAKAVRNKYRLPVIWKKFCNKLEGHIRYYGVSFNIKSVKNFLHRATRILHKWLNRRSQKRSFTWDKLLLHIGKNPLPRARICHTLW